MIGAGWHSEEAVDLLAKLNDPQTVPQLISSLDDYSDLDHRSRFAGALARLKDPRSAETILENDRLFSEPLKLWAVAQLLEQRNFAALIASIGYDTYAVVEACAKALVQLHGLGAVGGGVGDSNRNSYGLIGSARGEDMKNAVWRVPKDG